MGSDKVQMGKRTGGQGLGVRSTDPRRLGLESLTLQSKNIRLKSKPLDVRSKSIGFRRGSMEVHSFF